MPKVDKIDPFVFLTCVKTIDVLEPLFAQEMDLHDIIALCCSKVIEGDRDATVSACMRIAALMQHLADHPQDVDLFGDPSQPQVMPSSLIVAAATAPLQKNAKFKRNHLHEVAMPLLETRGHA